MPDRRRPLSGGSLLERHRRVRQRQRPTGCGDCPAPRSPRPPRSRRAEPGGALPRDRPACGFARRPGRVARASRSSQRVQLARRGHPRLRGARASGAGPPGPFCTPVRAVGPRDHPRTSRRRRSPPRAEPRRARDALAARLRRARAARRRGLRARPPRGVPVRVAAVRLRGRRAQRDLRVERPAHRDRRVGRARASPDDGPRPDAPRAPGRRRRLPARGRGGRGHLSDGGASAPRGAREVRARRRRGGRPAGCARRSRRADGGGGRLRSVAHRRLLGVQAARALRARPDRERGQSLGRPARPPGLLPGGDVAIAARAEPRHEKLPLVVPGRSRGRHLARGDGRRRARGPRGPRRCALRHHPSRPGVGPPGRRPRGRVGRGGRGAVLPLPPRQADGREHSAAARSGHR